MRCHIVSSLGEPVGKAWKELQEIYTASGDFYAAAPISNTPVPVYEWIINHAASFRGWDKFHFVMMDEQVEKKGDHFTYVPEDDPASLTGKIKGILLNPLKQETNLSLDTCILRPELDDLPAFDKVLKTHQGLDLLIVAIGEGGHYAQVMPGTPLQAGYHVTELLDSYKERHTQVSGQVFSGATFRDYGMSLGHQQFLEAKNVFVIISGEKKRDLVTKLFSHDAFDPNFPLSILYHPAVKERVELYITEDAYVK